MQIVNLDAAILSFFSANRKEFIPAGFLIDLFMAAQYTLTLVR